jgi:hypothetical protein
MTGLALGASLRHPIPARPVIVCRVILIHGDQAYIWNDRLDAYTMAVRAMRQTSLFRFMIELS